MNRIVPGRDRVPSRVRIGAAAGIAAIALLASACGGSGSGSSSSPASISAPTAPPSTASASPKEGLDFAMPDQKGGYIIHYPASWTEHNDLSGLSFRAPQSVGLAGIHYEATPDDLKKIAAKAPSVEKPTVSSFHLLKTTPVTIDGKKAVQLTYTGENSNKLPLKAFATWTVWNGKAYRFSFVASANYYDQLYSTAQKMMHSIHFTGH